MIVLFCGPPASGKSAIAKRLVKELEDWKLIVSDEFKRKTYRHMFVETERWAGRVRYLILDGTFYRKEWRDRIREIAEGKGEEVFTVYVTCSLETCLERNRLREEKIEEKEKQEKEKILHREEAKIAPELEKMYEHPGGKARQEVHRKAMKR